MQTCFFCGNEIPNITDPNILLCYLRCNDCKDKMNEGNVLIAYTDTPNFENQVPICYIQNDKEESTPVYPTGEWAVYTNESIEEFFDNKTAEQIIKTSIGFIKPEVFEEIKDIYKNVRIKSADDSDNEGDDTTCESSNESTP